MAEDSIDNAINEDTLSYFTSDTADATNPSGSSLDSLLGSVNKASAGASNILNALKGKPSANATARAKATGIQQYLPWIAGGVVLIVVLGLVGGKK